VAHPSIWRRPTPNAILSKKRKGKKGIHLWEEEDGEDQGSQQTAPENKLPKKQKGQRVCRNDTWLIYLGGKMQTGEIKVSLKHKRKEKG